MEPDTTQPRDRAPDLLRFERALSEISATLIGATSSNLVERVNAGIGRVLELFDLERGSVFERRGEGIIVRAAAAKRGTAPVTVGARVDLLMPWFTQYMQSRDVVHVSIDDIPASAPNDRAVVERMGLRSNLTVAIAVDHQPTFWFGMSAGRADYAWPDELVPRFRLLGEMFAAAFVRARAEDDRKAAEDELRKSEALFRELADNIHEVFWTFDLTTNELSYVSPAYETIWGQSRRALLARPESWLEAIHPEDRPRVEQALPHRRERGGYNVTYRIRRPDGTERWIRDRAYPIVGPNGQADRITGVATDITERVQADEQLRQMQKMEAVGALAAGVAHDFNNILSVILSYGSILADELGIDDPRRQDVEEILTAGGRAAQLTQQLLAFSRKQPERQTRVDVSELIRCFQKMLGRVIPESIVLVFDLTARRRVLIDPGQLEQVLLNLCVNARDAMPSGGRLHVASDDVELDDRSARRLHGRTGPHVRITVRDTGVGMDAATRARIFEPFFTTKDRGRGTGLGLSLVFGIVAQARGAIAVDSEPGRGATFELYLPAAAETSTVTIDVVAPERASGGGKETILLVEDDAQVRGVMRAVLEKRGYRVLVAADGLAALEVIDETNEPIHLLLTDVVMPHMSGLELAAEVAKLRPRTKLVCMSGYTDETTPGYGQAPSGITLLQKPILPDALTRKIRELLDEE